MSRNVRKHTFEHVRPAKIQIRLRIRAVCSESFQCAFWITDDAKFLRSETEDPNQTAWMRRLIWVFIWHTRQKARFYRTCFSMGDLCVHVSVRPFARSPFRQHLPWVYCERNSSYSFVPIVLKLCLCFLFHHLYTNSGYLLWAQLLLQFYTDCFETLHVFSSWYEYVNVV